MLCVEVISFYNGISGSFKSSTWHDLVCYIEWSLLPPDLPISCLVLTLSRPRLGSTQLTRVLARNGSIFKNVGGYLLILQSPLAPVVLSFDLTTSSQLPLHKVVEAIGSFALVLVGMGKDISLKLLWGLQCFFTNPLVSFQLLGGGVVIIGNADSMCPSGFFLCL